MNQQDVDLPATTSSQVQELEQRIQRIEQQEVGDFTTRDWIVCVVGALIVPYLVLWWFWP